MSSPGSAKPIRVVVNAIHAKSGGGLTYIRNLVPRLARLDSMEIHLLLHRDQFPLFQPIDEKIHAHLFDFKPGTLSTLAWEQLSVPKLARKLGADIVFSPANFGPLLAKNHFVLLRNAVSVIQVESRLFGKLYWLGLGLATLASVLTAKRAFAVSDIYVQKNFHTLIPAFARVIERHPDIKLVIAGQVIDTGYMERLEAIIRDQNLEGKIRFVGCVEVDELHRLYRDCQVFVFPSLIEDDALRKTLSMRAIERAVNFIWDLTAEKTRDVFYAALGLPRHGKPSQ